MLPRLLYATARGGRVSGKGGIGIGAGPGGGGPGGGCMRGSGGTK